MVFSMDTGIFTYIFLWLANINFIRQCKMYFQSKWYLYSVSLTYKLFCIKSNLKGKAKKGEKPELISSILYWYYLVVCNCISNCCNCEETLWAAAARLLTLDSCDSNSTIGSMFSRPLGNKPVRVEPPEEKCMFVVLRVLAPNTRRGGGGILLTRRMPVYCSS